MLIVGVVLVVHSSVRFRGLIAEGVYEVYRGELVKIERREQPTTYWAQVAMMMVTSAAGIFLLSQVGGSMHL
jgi:hypothetical protein